ncbi:hypothetical protein PGT21_031073 [Puccinia graminis f. sp. tritici]|uniref:Uncharacterized protein n=1 Tax=Puccinia graminis f. sp. tritici TaxID=56615 RepID=A0A5B0LQU3_PUCGR|nr:hypothetical protein PGT21_031073 [Puccinia graminis f. sp. tritici]
MKTKTSLWILVTKVAICKAELDLNLVNLDFYFDNYKSDGYQPLLGSTTSSAQPISLHSTRSHSEFSFASTTNEPTPDRTACQWMLEPSVIEERVHRPLTNPQETGLATTEPMVDRPVRSHGDSALNSLVAGVPNTAGNRAPDKPVSRVTSTASHWVEITPVTANEVSRKRLSMGTPLDTLFRVDGDSRKRMKIPTDQAQKVQERPSIEEIRASHWVETTPVAANEVSRKRLSMGSPLDTLFTVDDGSRKRMKMPTDQAQKVQERPSIEEIRHKASVGGQGEYVGTSRKDMMQTIGQQKAQISEPQAIDKIRVSEVEVEGLNLVFNMTVLGHILKDQSPKFFGVPWMFEKLIQSESNDSDEVLVIKPGEHAIFHEAFKEGWRLAYIKPEKEASTRDLSATPSTLAAGKLTEINKNLMVWRWLYRRRLGIDFEVLLERIRNIFANNPKPPGFFDDLPIKMFEFFFRYLFFVDMIITILPQPTEIVLKRHETFQTAVDTFEAYTKDLLKKKNFETDKIVKVAFIWKFIANWLAKDVNYSRAKMLSRTKTINVYEVNRDWKIFFSLVFSHSIIHFNGEFSKIFHSRS